MKTKILIISIRYTIFFLPNSCFVLSCFNSLRRYIYSQDKNPNFDYIKSIMRWEPFVEFDGEKLSEIQRQYSPSEITMLLRFCGFVEIEILSCQNGEFTDKKMSINEIEMLVIAKKI